MTLQQVRAMPPEEQRVAIAEAVGWKFKSSSCWHDPSGKAMYGFELPDYLNDLNAMHAAEKACLKTGEQWTAYYEELDFICDAMNDSRSAMAQQRAEALLAVMLP